MKMNYEDFLENVKEDLQELYNNGKISRADKLNADLGIEFSSSQEPLYFCGKYYSPTVFVMLNPGRKIEPKPVNKKFHKTFDAFWESYIKKHTEKKTDNTNVDEKEISIDNFDLKQAAFLFDFEEKGFNLPDFINIPTNKRIKLDALQTVLQEKLQLELIPYCSQNSTLQIRILRFFVLISIGFLMPF